MTGTYASDRVKTPSAKRGKTSRLATASRASRSIAKVQEETAKVQARTDLANAKMQLLNAKETAKAVENAERATEVGFRIKHDRKVHRIVGKDVGVA